MSLRIVWRGLGAALLLTCALDSHAQQYSVTDLGTLGGEQSNGFAINASGQVTGWDDGANTADHAFLYSNGAMQDLGTLGGAASQGAGINASGQVTGVS